MSDTHMNRTGAPGAPRPPMLTDDSFENLNLQLSKPKVDA